MKKIFTLIVTILIALQVEAQKPKEIQEKINLIKVNDTAKLKLYLQLSSYYTEKQADSALKYAMISKKIADNFNYQKFNILALDYLGRAQFAKGMYSEALATFKKQESYAKDNAEKAQIMRNQGNVYIEQGNQNAALSLYLKSLDVAYLSKHPLTIAISQVNIAYVYRQQGEYEKAVDYLLKASKIADKIQNLPLSSAIYAQLALVEQSRKSFTEAAKYATSAYDIYSKINNRQGIAISLTILAESYSELGNLNKAKEYIQEAYDLNVKLGDKRQILSSQNNLAEVNLALKNYDEALKFVTPAINGLRQYQILGNLSSAYTTRGKINIALQRFQNAENDIDSAIQISHHNKYRLQEKQALQALALLKSAQGKYSDAFNTMVNYSKLNDTLFNETNSKQINELKTKYETEKKQTQIDLLDKVNKLQQLSLFNKSLELEKQTLVVNNQELEITNKNLTLTKKENEIQQKNLLTTQQKQKIEVLHQQTQIQNLKIKQRTILLSVAVTAILLLVLFFYLMMNKRKLKAKSELQSEIIKQQDITSKSVLEAEERERRRIAGDLHDGVGQMLSAALMNLNTLLFKLNLTEEKQNQAEKILALVSESYDEMRSISHQMMPNALIKSGLATAVKEFITKLNKEKLKTSLEIHGLDKRLDDQVETVIYRVIQESVNNVIKHAEATKLDIQIVYDQEGVDVTIEDNGKGFDKHKANSAAGIGLSNIYSRVAFLKGTVDIDSAEGRGTLIAIHIPV